jgi:hypothetical protein
MPSPVLVNGCQETFFEPTWSWRRLTTSKPPNERDRFLCGGLLLANHPSHGAHSLIIWNSSELTQHRHPDAP